ncbi:putative nuclease HARBI1 [Dermacentor albipictus]|uniref:putative nuclease HARBI1 n=1 Tax=Dermacentor albipictus TaxID=60249 RepID=UPI0038FC1C4B
MAQSSVSDPIHEVALAITVVGQQKGWVSFPMTSAAKASAQATFASRGRIPGVVACVDGALIVIQQPKWLNPGETQSFMIRKGYYAPNTMVVCDGDMKILDIDPRFRGSCHDSFVWRHTPLRSRLETVLRPGEIVLGDSGYPLSSACPSPGLQRLACPAPRLACPAPVHRLASSAWPVQFQRLSQDTQLQTHQRGGTTGRMPPCGML